MSNNTEQLFNILENINNPHNNALARSSLIQQYLQESGISKIELAKKLKKSPSYISNNLRLLQLPEVIKEALLSGIISPGHCRALSFLSAKRDTLQVFEEIIRHNYSVRETESAVNKLRTQKRQYGKVAQEFKNLTQEFARRWQVEAQLKRRNGKLMLTIGFPFGIVGLQKIRKMLNTFLHP